MIFDLAVGGKSNSVTAGTKGIRYRANYFELTFGTYNYVVS